MICSGPLFIVLLACEDGVAHLLTPFNNRWRGEGRDSRAARQEGFCIDPKTRHGPDLCDNASGRYRLSLLQNYLSTHHGRLQPAREQGTGPKSGHGGCAVLGAPRARRMADEARQASKGVIWMFSTRVGFRKL